MLPQILTPGTPLGELFFGDTQTQAEQELLDRVDAVAQLLGTLPPDVADQTADAILEALDIIQDPLRNHIGQDCWELVSQSAGAIMRGQAQVIGCEDYFTRVSVAVENIGRLIAPYHPMVAESLGAAGDRTQGQWEESVRVTQLDPAETPWWVWALGGLLLWRVLS